MVTDHFIKKYPEFSSVFLHLFAVWFLSSSPKYVLAV